MPLIKACLLPHSPLLIPEIGRANYAFLKKTVAAYQTIGQDLSALKAEVLLIISPHGQAPEQGIVLNMSPEMEIDLKEFGFIPAHTVFHNATGLSDSLANGLAGQFPLSLAAEKLMDYGTAIPVWLLKDCAPNLRIVSLSFSSELDQAVAYRFGQALAPIIAASEKRVAVIASGDLSHRLKRKSPGGYSPKGPKFDNRIIEMLNDPASAAQEIGKLDKNLAAAAGECGLRPLTAIVGLLEGKTWQPEVLAYQTEFGVGYLSFDFKLD